MTRNELPSEEMYVSGRSLYPLSIALAAKLSEEFEGGLQFLIPAVQILIILTVFLMQEYGRLPWPLTVLKPGGWAIVLIRSEHCF